MPIGPARLAASLGLLLAAAPAFGQTQPSRPVSPDSATSSQLPPASQPNDPATRPRTQTQPPPGTGTGMASPPNERIRTEPPAGHVVVPAPPRSPTAQMPSESRSDGIFGSGSDPIPSRPAQQPDATETGREGGGQRR